MGNNYTIKEYDSFVCEKTVPGYTTLPQKTFEQLEEFVLSNRTNDADALDLMSISGKKGGIGKVITAKNYVGVISMTDGTRIEILPKIFSRESHSDDQIKRLLVKMIRTLNAPPYKTIQTSLVDTAKMNVFEIYIRMFIDEVFGIVKRGLKCDYQVIQRNENAIKGKIIFSEHIKRNIVHKEKVYVEYDEFNINRPENRLIKSTLIYLYKKSISAKNKSDLKTLLSYFVEVDESLNYLNDISLCKNDRNTADYKNALVWCQVFLKGESFTSFSGSKIAYALLFPMEVLFESYVAKKIKECFRGSKCLVKIQDKRYHLFDEPSKKFLIKPDIVIRNSVNKSVFLCDTKWKMLSDSAPNYGISQSDMYQMYAYQKKYNAESVTLLYPKTDKVINENIEFKSDDALVKVRFVDLFDDNSIFAIKDAIYGE
ncbi:MAG: McrC family protein [Clostridiales bacterium]|nr:McrC family protein [Clostridiales bacterium]